MKIQKKAKIGFISRINQPYSLDLYQSQIINNLTDYVEFIPIKVIKDDGINEFIEKTTIKYDLIWDACIAGARSPIVSLSNFNCPIILTVHDATPFVMSDDLYYRHSSHIKRGHQRQGNVRNNWLFFNNFCSEIITVSNFAKKEISDAFKINNEKITIIYHGVDSKIYKPAGDSIKLEKPFFLNICQYQPVKNIDFALRAFSKTKYVDDFLFILIAPTFESSEMYNFLKHIPTYNNPTELSNWYRGATGFIFPSLHESFGLPVLEAMACGCPVIASGTTACEEIVKNNGILIDPYNEEELIKQIENLIENTSIQNDLSELGYKRSLNFTWQKSASEHLAIFNKYITP